METGKSKYVVAPRLALTLASILGLYACGGGGGGVSGAGGTDGSGTTPPAVVPDGAISTANAEKIVKQVLNAPALMVAAIDYIPTTGLGQLQASTKSAHPMMRSTTSLTCPAGGSQAWTYTQAVPGQWAVGDRWDYTATQCGLTSTLRENGRVTGVIRSSSGIWDVGGAGNLVADLTYSALSLIETGSGIAYQTTVDGSLVYTLRREAEVTRMSVSASSSIQLALGEGGDTFKAVLNSLNHAVQINVANGSYTLDSDVNVVLTSQSDATVNGTYRVQVDPVLAGTYDTGLDLFAPPESGTITTIGPNGARVVLAMATGGVVSMAVDTNGDGLAERVDYPLWDNLYKR